MSNLCQATRVQQHNIVGKWGGMGYPGLSFYVILGPSAQLSTCFAPSIHHFFNSSYYL